MALHVAVAARLLAQPELIEVARARVRGWLASGDRPYAREWSELLQLPLSQLCEAIVERGERAVALRQCSPFAGVLDARARWRILSEAQQRAGS